MKTYIVAKNVCNLYAAGSDSELVSQAVLGDVVESDGAEERYMHVRTPDLYAGRIRAHALVQAPKASYNKGCHDSFPPLASRQVVSLFAPVHKLPSLRSELVTTLVMSTVVAAKTSVRSFWQITLPDGKTGFVSQRHLRPPTEPIASLSNATIFDANKLAGATALRLVGTPYLWGGSTPYGIDCSGFTQLCYRMAGVPLLRDARLQINDRRWHRVASGQSFDRARLKTGDLVFFGETPESGGPPKVTHVGMILPGGRMIHSAGGFGVVVEKRRGHRYLLKYDYLGARRLKPGAPAQDSAA